MASVQVREWRVHPFVETIQDESGGGKGAFEAPGEGTAEGWGGCGSKEGVIRVPV